MVIMDCPDRSDERFKLIQSDKEYKVLGTFQFQNSLEGMYK